MATTTTKRRYFVAVNRYRSSTSDGISNTWEVRECEDQSHQRHILSEGLPVRDQVALDASGRRGPVYSTMGVRAATAAEVRRAKHDETTYRYPIARLSSEV